MAGAGNGQFTDLAGARQTRGKMWRGGPKRTRQLGILRDLDSPVTSRHVESVSPVYHHDPRWRSNDQAISLGTTRLTSRLLFSLRCKFDSEMRRLGLVSLQADAACSEL